MTAFLLTIVVPVRNAAAHIPALADAFARQKPDSFEVVFIDDGSTDESAHILEKIAATGAFPVRIACKAHAGVSAARNAGMALATGRYVAFVDADDMIAPDYVDALASCASRGGDLYVFRHSRVVHGSPVFTPLCGAQRIVSSDDLLELFLTNPTHFGVYDFLVSRALIEGAGLRFPEGYPYYEDYDFTLRLFDAAQKIWSVERCIYCYHAAPNSAMSTYSRERLRCLELFDEPRSQYLVRHRSFYVRYRKWFVARLSWSVLWQTGVAVNLRAARAFVRDAGMRMRMRQLTDYPDRRVRWSARAFGLFPFSTILILKACGKGRTLLARER